MGRGKKTITCGAVALTTVWTAPFDPTGASLIVFLGASTGFAAGTIYHGAKKTLEVSREVLDEIQEHMEEKRLRKSQNNMLGLCPSEHIQFQYNVEATFRRLAASIGGVTINGVLLAKMPVTGIVFFFNLKQALRNMEKLHGLAEGVGGYSQVIKNVSLRNVALQGLGGIAIKAITTFTFMGNDFTDFMGSISDMADHFSSHPLHVEGVVGTYSDLIQEEPLKFTTALANYPVDAMKEHFEHSDDWDWEDHNSLTSVLSVGATVAAVDKAVGIAADDPLHKAADGFANGKGRARA